MIINISGSHNPVKSIGSWSFLVLNDNGCVINKSCGEEKDSTHQKMELIALLNSLVYVKKNNQKIDTILSNNAYIVNCFKDKWYQKWIDNGWISSKGEPVANKDLWVEIISLYLDLGLSILRSKPTYNNQCSSE